MRRRDFIRVSSGVAGLAAVGTGLSGNWFDLYANPIPDPETDGDRIVPSFCELCFWKCGILAHVKDGRVTKIRGNPRDPLSRGHLCPRGTGGTGLLYANAARRFSRKCLGTMPWVRSRGTSIGSRHDGEPARSPCSPTGTVGTG